MCGFGVVEPLPGLVNWHVNTAVTLPVGVETYAAYAAGVWLNPNAPARARRFAGWSTLAGFLLGALGQVAYHVMASFGLAHAPWQVVALVATLPVAVLGAGATLAHMLTRHDAPDVARIMSPGDASPAARGWHVVSHPARDIAPLSAPPMTRAMTRSVAPRAIAPAGNDTPPSDMSRATRIAELRDAGTSWDDIATQLGISKRTAQRAMPTPTKERKTS